MKKAIPTSARTTTMVASSISKPLSGKAKTRIRSIKVVGIPNSEDAQRVPSLDKFLMSIRPKLKPLSPAWRFTEAVRLYDTMRAEEAFFGSGKKLRTTCEKAVQRLKSICPAEFQNF